MKNRVGIEIGTETFEELQKLARPLLDDAEAVIRRLLDHWKQAPPGRGQATPSWKSWRGERLPVGTKLRALYDGEEFTGAVTPSGIAMNGETFTSPSAAAIHAKRMKGLTGNSANTNGWKFWEYWNEQTQSWHSLSDFRNR